MGAVSLGERERREKDEGSQAVWVSWGSNKPHCFALKLKKRNKKHFLPSVISNQRRGKLTRERKSSFAVPNFDISSGPK